MKVLICSRDLDFTYNMGLRLKSIGFEPSVFYNTQLVSGLPKTEIGETDVAIFHLSEDAHCDLLSTISWSCPTLMIRDGGNDYYRIFGALNASCTDARLKAMLISTVNSSND